MKSFSYLPWGYGYTSRSAKVHNYCTCNMYMSAPPWSDWSNMIVTDRWQSQIRSGRNSLHTHNIILKTFLNLFVAPIVSYSVCGCEKWISKTQIVERCNPSQLGRLNQCRVQTCQRNGSSISTGIPLVWIQTIVFKTYYIKHQISSTLNLSCYFISMINLCHQLPTPKEFFSR